jgi:hypothetical protein
MGGKLLRTIGAQSSPHRHTSVPHRSTIGGNRGGIGALPSTFLPPSSPNRHTPLVDTHRMLFWDVSPHSPYRIRSNALQVVR